MSAQDEGEGRAAAATPPPASGGGQPLLATIVGSVLVLLSLGQPIGLSGDRAERLAYALGTASAPLLLIWGGAYAITIRKASTAWKIGSFVTIALISILVTLVRIGADATASDRDLAAAEEQLRRFSQDPGAEVVAGKDAGPYSRMVASLLQDTVAERRAFERQTEQARFEQIVTLRDLAPTSPALSHCDRFDVLAAGAETIGRNFPTHLAKARAIGISGGMPEGQLRAFEAGYGKADYQGSWRLNGQLMTGAGEMCRFLASHKWVSRNGEVLFVRGADMMAFNKIAARVQSIAAEQQRRAAEGAAALERQSSKKVSATR